MKDLPPPVTMKDLPPPPQPSQPLNTRPPRGIYIQVLQDYVQETPAGGNQALWRAHSARRRLVFDDEPAGEEDAGAGVIGDLSSIFLGPRWPLPPPRFQPGGSFRRKSAAAETAAASRRWNFDFVNERPLEGQWQWEKVGDQADIAADVNKSDPQPADPVDEGHPPQR